jgi:hypothetical protein
MGEQAWLLRARGDQAVTAGSSPLWSILIPTVIWREEKLLALLRGLLPQCESSPEAIEVVALQNVGQKSLARYRQDLLDSARGEYVSFVDDDDEVPLTYVDLVTKALATRPDVVGVMQICSGLAATLTIISLGNVDPPMWPGETEYGHAYLRSFSHVCPVRTEVARQGSFMGRGELWTGEDAAFVDSVLPVLRGRGSREVFVDTPLYHYRWSASDTTQSLGVAPTGIAARAASHRRPHIPSLCFRWHS